MTHSAETRARFVADPTDPRHGTPNGYANLGCHCDDCTAAETARRQSYMQRHPEQRERVTAAQRARRNQERSTKYLPPTGPRVTGPERTPCQ